MANCMVLTNIPENLLSSEVELQPLDGRSLGNTKMKQAKAMCRFELDTGPGIMMPTVIHCWADKS
jgi:hypothetical protein